VRRVRRLPQEPLREVSVLPGHEEVRRSFEAEAEVCAETVCDGGESHLNVLPSE